MVDDPKAGQNENADQKNDGKENDAGRTGENIESLDEAFKVIGDLRDEAAKYRTRSKKYVDLKEKHEQLLSKMKKFEQVFGDGDEVDPNELKTTNENLEKANHRLQVENAVVKMAGSKVDTDLLISYLQSKNRLEKVDPSDAEAMKAIIDEAIEEKPNLKLNADKIGDSEEGEGEHSSAFDMNARLRSHVNR